MDVSGNDTKTNIADSDLKQSNDIKMNDSNLNENSTKSNKKSKKKNRCINCNKKIGLIPFSCKCGNVYCAKCRYPEQHNCTFDWVKDGKEKILKENPQIINSKLNKID